MKDTYNLNRFIMAQDSVYESVINELESGMKQGCWMWYIFPQVLGLGFTTTSIEFSISSKEEANAYLQHPILGERLKQCTSLVLNIEGRSAEQIFHHPDYLKFRSSMTLFDYSSNEKNIFFDAIAKYFGGESDSRTLVLLEDIHK